MCDFSDGVKIVRIADDIECVLHSDGVFYAEPTVEFLLELKDAIDTTLKNYKRVGTWAYRYSESKFGRMIKYNADPNAKSKPDDGRFVYLIHNSHSNIYKIGLSKNPKSRLAALQTVTIDKLTLVGFLKGGYDLERRLHAKYRHLKVSGEWFEACDELLNEFINP